MSSFTTSVQFQRSTTAIALSACRSSGFALAGGSALREHGLTMRPTEDIDLFTTNPEPQAFSQAVHATRTALEKENLHVEILRQSDAFASLRVISPDNLTTVLDMGLDWRANPAVELSIGPVLHQDDAVANKVLAVFGRAYPRDFIDLSAILQSNAYTPEQLLELATIHDPGFDLEYFVQSLAQVQTINPSEVTAYGVSEHGWEQVVSTIAEFKEFVNEQRQLNPALSLHDRVEQAFANYSPTNEYNSHTASNVHVEGTEHTGTNDTSLEQ